MITVQISAHDHEEAHVASARFLLPGAEAARAEEELKKQLSVTVRWADEMNLLIGHAKAYLSWGEENARMLSTTGCEVETKGSEVPRGLRDVEAGVTLIVFGGSLEDAEDRLEGLSSAVAGQFGGWCAFHHDCGHEHHHHDRGHSHDHEHDGHGERDECC